MMTPAMTALAARPPLLDRLRAANARLPMWLGPVLAIAGLIAIVVFSDPDGVYGTGREALCYWTPSYADPYLHSEWNDPIAYVYSPAFLHALAPLKWLPWPAFLAAWTVIQLVVLRFLTGSRWLWLGLLLAAMEIGGGNISLLLAAAIVLGFRHPAAWALVLLTKVTPGIGLLWFAVRREWRNLAIALGATAAIAAVSFVIAPQAWLDWADVLVRTATSGRSGTWASIPIPLLLRLPFAIALVVWGARTDRRWTVLVAALIALPAVWYGSLSMLIGLFALQRMGDVSRDPTTEGPSRTVAVEPARG
jgi:hypothetical protein